MIISLPNLYNKKWCVVFDNCLDHIDDLEFIKKPNIKVIINSKKCYGVYMLKKRMDYIILLKDNNIEKLQKYYSTYGHMFLTFDTFKKYFETLMKKSDSMIINIIYIDVYLLIYIIIRILMIMKVTMEIIMIVRMKTSVVRKKNQVTTKLCNTKLYNLLCLFTF